MTFFETTFFTPYLYNVKQTRSASQEEQKESEIPSHRSPMQPQNAFIWMIYMTNEHFKSGNTSFDRICLPQSPCRKTRVRQLKENWISAFDVHGDRMMSALAASATQSQQATVQLFREVAASLIQDTRWTTKVHTMQVESRLYEIAIKIHSQEYDPLAVKPGDTVFCRNLDTHIPMAYGPFADSDPSLNGLGIDFPAGPHNRGDKDHWGIAIAFTYILGLDSAFCGATLFDLKRLFDVLPTLPNVKKKFGTGKVTQKDIRGFRGPSETTLASGNLVQAYVPRRNENPSTPQQQSDRTPSLDGSEISDRDWSDDSVSSEEPISTIH